MIKYDYLSMDMYFLRYCRQKGIPLCCYFIVFITLSLTFASVPDMMVDHKLSSLSLRSTMHVTFGRLMVSMMAIIFCILYYTMVQHYRANESVKTTYLRSMVIELIWMTVPLIIVAAIVVPMLFTMMPHA